MEAKASIQEITSEALYFYPGMMKDTTELSFTAKGCSVGARLRAGHLEVVLGSSPWGNVR